MTQRKAKVVITDYGFNDIDRERRLIEGAGHDLVSFQCKSEEEVIEAASDADALLVQYAPLTGSVLDRLSRCKVIVRYGIGVDNVDLDKARTRGITVCNVPDYCIDDVADHTLALALALFRQLTGLNREVQAGIWNSPPAQSMPAARQMIFATIGYGQIARAVLNRARAFKFNLAACDPYLSLEATIGQGVEIFNLDGLLQVADVISLHVPLNRGTTRMIDATTIGKMKKSALLINTARGGLIDSVALAQALDAGMLGGAGLDVFDTEPIPADHPLLKCKNVVLTPHMAWYSDQSGATLQRMAAEEVLRVLAGESVRSRGV